MPGVEVKINNPDENGIGELFARGPNIMKGYLDDEEANREVFVDGWFNTGDLARIDEEDYIFLTGYDLRRGRRLAGRLASIKVVFSEEYEDVNYTDSDVERLYSEIEKDVNETIWKEKEKDET